MQIQNLFRKYNIGQFLIHFFGFYLLVMCARFLTTSGKLDLCMWQGYQLSFALSFASVSALFDYKKKNTILFLIVSFLWGAACLCKIGVGMVLSEREIVQTIGFGTVSYVLFSVLLYLTLLVKNKFFALLLKCCVLILFALVLLPPLLVIGYYVVSDGHMLSSNILLTLFQTNVGEVYAYLAEQNVWLWGVSMTAIIAVSVLVSYLLGHIRVQAHLGKLLVFNLILIVYLIFSVVPKLSSSFAVNMFVRVADTLKEYKSYALKSSEREARLKTLKDVLKSDDGAGLHVLVMGESTVRHHLGAFGYERNTTPWLSKMVSENENTIIYPKAYSSNIQTVMSIQFALTSQNQYNGVSLEDSYSLTEVATAAGYDTYWISNQMHFNAYDTPISAIFNGANHRIFINDYFGTRLLTTYYDEMLSDKFPKIDENKKTLVVFHLMGCHNLYIDRYPAEFKTFVDGNDERANSYDDCILYNDYVLSLLYQKAAQNKNFMSFTFLSDHGEDPDKGLTHDYSKFTWNMPHIPFVTIFSDSYVVNHKDIVQTLQSHKNSYWTSDLLFNMMTHVLGIENVPHDSPKFDLSKSEYAMTRDNLTIIEGTYRIKDDDTTDR